MVQLRNLLIVIVAVEVIGMSSIDRGISFVASQLQAAQPKTVPGNRKPKQKKKAEPAVHAPLRSQQIAKIDASTRKAALASAARIDELIDANLLKHQVSPNTPTSDEQFLRRIYLEIVGTIPTLQQTRAFLTSPDHEKRSRLIDSLLSQEGYSSNFYNYWADILRLKDGQIANNVPGRPYCEWVKVSLEMNMPYDKFVYEMLTAEGKIWDDPAAGYILRDSGMPLDAMNNTVRVFLGTQIGCAQCHNHPFDRWTQKEFYEMAAFTFGTTTRRGAGDKKFGGGNVVNKLRTDLKKVDPKFDGGGKYNRLLVSNLAEVYDRPAKLQLPHDYQYDDAKPKQAVDPKTIFEPQAKLEKDEPPRIAFARWLTSAENPRFGKTIANRLWKKSFGVGLIEPIDDIKDDSQPENPELMEFLTAEMVRVKFDLKEYLRIIYNTKAYQREAAHAEVNPGDEFHFPGPILRRMTAEQVWDSFITLAAYKPNEYQAEPASVEAKLVNIDLATATADLVYKRDQQLRSAELRKTREARDKDHSYKGTLLVRASELPSPRPPGHFLRQFGQSDRESIEASSVDGSVPQVLQMFNGPITHMLLEPTSVLCKNVFVDKSPEARVDIVFLSILARKPSAEERQAALGEVKAHGDAGYGNVVWALVNTREFLFIQ
ncbi:DUF1549 and DUF1553 domain-containing protein [Schlesneria paludicola]|uniref:DUF1549 and DUF1553 domain-containing protein n=1 Tax=Schlesneria paludicola TaxID=360056 RepID=UPI00029A89A7|nr:DUF1549 and DUF1553 domain-containing protein [Schlesneria paludicola]